MSRIKLSYQKGKGFKKCVGKHVGRDGTQKPKTWWLGLYEEPAQKLAETIVAEWRELKKQRIDHWTDDAVERIELFRNGGTKPIETSSACLIQQQQYTTHQLFELFRSHVLSSTKADSTKNTTFHQINQLKTILNDLPLSMIHAIELRDQINRISVSDLSEASKFNLVKLFRAAMDWADRHEIWIAPRRFNDFFKCKWKQSGTIRTFDQPELQALWLAANDSQRLYLALMLNCGFTAIDIARLQYNNKKKRSFAAEDYEEGMTYVHPNVAWKERNSDVKMWYTGWYIIGKRTKTDVFGVFHLWDVTAQLLSNRLHIGTAILNGEGNPLVAVEIEGGRTDFVGQSLRKLIHRVNADGKCRKLPVKCFRKTGSQLVRDVGGLEMSKLYLRHSADSMAERHYNSGNFNRLNDVLSQVYGNLHEALRVSE